MTKKEKQIAEENAEPKIVVENNVVEDVTFEAETVALRQTIDNLVALKAELIGVNTLAAERIAELERAHAELAKENADLKERLSTQAKNFENTAKQAAQALEANGNLRAQIATQAPSLNDPAIRAQVCI